MRGALMALSLAAACALAGCTADEGKDEAGPATDTGAGADTGSLAIRATYTGTAQTGGTGRIFAYLYKNLSTAQAAPDYQGSTPSEAAVGTEYTITVAGVAPGDYYLMLFYDYRMHNQHQAGNGDRYVLYPGQHLPGGATAVAVRTSAPVTLGPVAFGDDYLLGSGGSYQ